MAGLETIEKGQRWIFDVGDRGGPNLVAVNVHSETATLI